ncbi:unnamed protein product [marine sediment metagenome]|uniref:Uncharacterized protein n=1 Tax=marine sediment metagenome TaxID=412755 RepID=X0X006_9ZZZZ
MSSTVAAVRWACTNGLVGLHNKAHTVKIRHTIKAEERIEEALRIMAGVSTYLEDTTRLMEELLRTPVAPTVVEQLIPVPRRTDDNERAVRSAEKRQSELLATWRNSENLEGIRDTGWGFINAVAEFNEWTGSHVSRRTRTPMERLLAGTGQDIVREARELVLAG